MANFDVPSLSASEAAFLVSRGRSRIAIPRWCVLNGDRLAVSAHKKCLQAQHTMCLFSSGDNLASRDLTLDALKPYSHCLAIRTPTPDT
ncbi:MAG: hypothetical protein KME08_21455 [Aphanothece sp. CMT-3BRIN-NPC111]|nr:hypothetical protein [Aphanothece sp. CMT-3BRIN-NPC111]